MIDERHHNQYVEIPVSSTDRAWSEAHRIMAERYPGMKATLANVEKLKEQILKGEQ